jgi:hypothetical protein
MKGYKVFNSDFTCRGFKYKIGEIYEMEQTPELCGRGFHFCKKAADCFNYYDFDSENKVAEIIAHGEIDDGDDKCATNKIEIVREIPWGEVLALVNTGIGNSGYRNSGNRNSGNWNSGNWNSGDWNSGDCNSGFCNSGDRNSGNRNSGNWNSGNWNACNRESGFFNSKQSEIVRVFNKECKLKEWEMSKKPDFIYFELTKYQNDELVSYDYKEAFKASYENAKNRSDFDEQIKLLKALPNFDADVFFEISGIRID